MFVVALTGGIASGKSTAANYFQELDIDVISADQISRDLTAPGSECEETIIQHFGAEHVVTDGHLDRRKCRLVIFSEPEKKTWLENLLHPKIRRIIQIKLTQVRSAYAVVEIPLLVESNSYEYIDRVCVIDTDHKTQLTRATARDHSNIESIKQIIAQQALKKDRLAIADDIIINNGNLDTLKKRVQELNHLYLQLSVTA